MVRSISVFYLRKSGSVERRRLSVIECVVAAGGEALAKAPFGRSVAYSPNITGNQHDFLGTL